MSGGSGYGSHRPTHVAVGPDPQSIAWVIGASLLMGAGLFLISTWIITFDFVYFVGFGALLVGALMILSPRMGADHA
ncbi:MAG: hypothetical protein L3K01_02905 [Thermoplasmata archaeon]|nr:hypothetical protein [Thermoplasmata archaeon]